MFWHRRSLIRPGDTPIVTPNTDTLHSTVWLDLRAGPAVIDVPDTADRYYVLGFLDFYTNPFAHIGQRATGTGEGSLLVTGPGWDDDVPIEFQRPLGRVKCPTPWVRVIGRIMVDGQTDLAAAHAVQDGLQIRSFDGAPAPGRFSPECDHCHPADAAHFAAQVNAALSDCPPPADEWEMVARFAQIALRYLGMHETREAVYPMAWFDSDGNPLDGRNDYVLRFPPGELPPVDAFWSLTMYSAATMNLVENARQRYAIGDRTQGLQQDADGGLTIVIQHEPPATPARAANWLPAPSGAFYLCLRAYLPKPQFRDGSYRIPPVTLNRG